MVIFLYAGLKHLTRNIISNLQINLINNKDKDYVRNNKFGIVIPSLKNNS